MTAKEIQKPFVDRRLKEIQEETKKIRHDIRSLSKTLKQSNEPGRGMAPKSAMGKKRRQESGPDGIQTSGKSVAGRIMKPRDRGHDEAGPREKKPGGTKKDQTRFAHYLAGGSFGSGMPLRQERAVQRNKAIFMVILVLLVGFIVIQLVIGP